MIDDVRSVPAFAPRDPQPDDDDAPYRALAAGVVRQAVTDLRAGSQSCARQVRAGTLAPWLERLGLDECTTVAVQARLLALASRVG